jgi:hypothetical protein
MANDTLKVKHKISFVKTFPLEKLKIVKNYMLLHNEMRPFCGPTSVSSVGDISYDFHAFRPAPPDSCPFNVPLEYRTHHKRIIRARGPRKEPKEKYPKLFSEAASGYVSDSTLLSTFSSRLSERPLIFLQYETDEASVFYGKIKGSDDYNKSMTDKINLASTALVKNYGFFYFLTFTYAYKIYGADIVKAWDLFSKQVSKTMRKLRKVYKMGYVCVFEATKKGYPHAHIILGIQEPAEKWHVNLGDGHRIKHGDFFNFIQKNVASPVFAIQKAGGKGLVKYLGKYISKGAEQIVKAKRHEGSKLSDPERKALLSCLMPVLAKKRQYRFSIRDNFVPGIAWNKCTDDDIALLKDLVQMGITTPEGDAILIRLLINLTTECSCSAWVVFNKTFKKTLEPSIGYYSQAPPGLLEDFQAWGYPMGCPGCIVTAFLYNLEHPESVPHPMPGQLYAEIINSGSLAS